MYELLQGLQNILCNLYNHITCIYIYIYIYVYIYIYIYIYIYMNECVQIVDLLQVWVGYVGTPLLWP